MILTKYSVISSFLLQIIFIILAFEYWSTSSGDSAPKAVIHDDDDDDDDATDFTHCKDSPSNSELLNVEEEH